MKFLNEKINNKQQNTTDCKKKQSFSTNTTSVSHYILNVGENTSLK